MKSIFKSVKKSTAFLMLLAFTVGTVSFSVSEFTKTARASNDWNTTGEYVINMNYLGTDYPHDMTLVQDGSGNLTGNGGSPAGANVYTWVINSGDVDGNDIDFTANYTATDDAVTPQTVLVIDGTIAEDGTMSGAWSDNYQGQARSGTFSTVSGEASSNEPAPQTVKVTIKKYVDGSMATASSANNADFPMSATWNADNTGAGTGEYALSENGYNGDTTAYKAMTTDMTSGADYSTYEMTNTGVVGTSCAIENTEYALVGYKSGDTLADALASTSTMIAPSFTDMTTDKFVIVMNDKCSTDDVNGEIQGEVIGDNGELAVTSIEMTDSTATANNSFEDGWEYVFNITVPTDETDVSMKFANWMISGGGSTIAAANNMRISSAQANNSGATVMVVGANTYTTPTLTMITDLNPSLDGMQVQVVVEVKIPTGTTNGSYSTNYGVKSE